MTQYNPHLDQFLMFYSQSDSGNGLTRGLESEIAKQTYVDTKLDDALTPRVLRGDLRLVVLTGNAGDGKTAFIQTVERRAEASGASPVAQDSLGSKFNLNGTEFRTLYDGSVDVIGRTNFEMLSEFFSSLSGDQEPGPGPCLIVAMNEGKLRDFLGKTTDHRWLSAHLLGHMLNDEPLPEGYVVVNLNLRSVVDATEEPDSSLLDRILDRYVANEFWEACEGCPAKQHCPVKFNVDTFRIFPLDDSDKKDREATAERNSSARVARARLKAVFQILHFRKRIHVTVRDLRSALAFALFGKKTCAQIDAEIQIGQVDFVDRFYYNALFSDSETDRVISLLREFDVGQTAAPQIDSRLSFTQPKSGDFRSLFLDFTNSRVAHHGRNRSDEDGLKRLYDERPRSPEERTRDSLEKARRHVLSVRRKLFFEGDRLRHPGITRPQSGQSLWVELLPYDNLSDFIRFVGTGTDTDSKLKIRIVEGISRSEGIHDGRRSSENICIRTRQDVDARVKAFYTYPGTDFTVQLPSPGPQARFIEYLPSSVLFKHIQTGVTLEVSLDLYEMLMRIHEGYVPTAGEMRAFFLNLLMFKKQLMALPSKELLLTETDYQIFKLTRTPQNGVSLSSL